MADSDMGTLRAEVAWLPKSTEAYYILLFEGALLHKKKSSMLYVVTAYALVCCKHMGGLDAVLDSSFGQKKCQMLNNHLLSQT